MCEIENKSNRSSIWLLKDNAIVKTLRKRFENYTNEPIISKPPKKNATVIIRRHTMRDPTIVDHRKGLMISKGQLEDLQVGNSAFDSCDEANGNIKNPSFVHKQFRQVCSRLSYLLFCAIYLYWNFRKPIRAIPTSSLILINHADCESKFKEKENFDLISNHFRKQSSIDNENLYVNMKANSRHIYSTIRGHRPPTLRKVSDGIESIDSFFDSFDSCDDHYKSNVSNINDEKERPE